MSELEQLRAALLSITEVLAMALAQRPQWEAEAIELMRMANAGEYEALAKLGDEMSDRIMEQRVGEAH